MDAALFLCYNQKKSVNYERKKQMSDLYSELLVKKKQTGKDLAIKYGLIALTVIMVLGGLVLNALLLVPAIALGVACYFVIPKTDLEYEYLFPIPNCTLMHHTLTLQVLSGHNSHC